MDNTQSALDLHEEHGGKLAIQSKVPLRNREDLSLAYTPGVAAPCKEIAADPDEMYRYTMKGNSVAVVTDGSAVLSLGNIGPGASLPVMEGKCILFKHYADIDAFPVCIEAATADEFVDTVKRIASPYGGINLEDIAAPLCFEIEERLSAELDIPVMHDDQHGTAIVVLAAFINAMKVVGKKAADVKVVISGAGAAGSGVAHLLLAYGVKNIVVCDRKGALFTDRNGIAETPRKMALAAKTNPDDIQGVLLDVIKGADVFIGVSQAGLVTAEMVASMAERSVIFALANPTPEIMPEIALEAGAAVVGTGRSDFPNQINNALAFPGVFRGLLDARVSHLTDEMKVAAAEALAQVVKNPERDTIVPDLFASEITEAIAQAIVRLAS